MSPAPSPSDRIHARLEALRLRARGPLGFGQIEQLALEAEREIGPLLRQMMLGEQTEHAEESAAFPPSGLPALPAGGLDASGPQAPHGPDAGRPGAL